jgi:hypothetical protein
MNATSPCSGVLASSVNETVRLRWLIAIHLLLATVHAWIPLLPTTMRHVPALWALTGISVTPMLLLALWCALGTSRLRRQLLGGLLGVLYLGCCTVLREIVRRSQLHDSPPSMPDLGNTLAHYGIDLLQAMGLTNLFLIIFAGVLRALSPSIEKLQRIPPADDQPIAGRPQFSIQHLLAGVTLAAVVCGLSRGASYRWPPWTPVDWQGLSQEGLFVIADSAVLIAAARGALSPGPIGGRAWRALAFAALVGIAYSIAMPSGDLAWWVAAWWWILLNGILLMTLPAAILIASLLVVRSCGFRLVPLRTSAPVRAGGGRRPIARHA